MLPSTECQNLKRGSLTSPAGCHLVSQLSRMLPLTLAADMCMISGCRMTTSPACTHRRDASQLASFQGRCCAQFTRCAMQGLRRARSWHNVLSQGSGLVSQKMVPHLGCHRALTNCTHVHYWLKQRVPTCISAIRQSRLYRPICCCREAPLSVSHPLNVPSLPTELCPYVHRKRSKALDLCDPLQTCNSSLSGNSLNTSSAMHCILHRHVPRAFPLRSL